MIKYHRDLEQGTDEWFAARCGLLTASEMKNIITPATLKYAEKKEERTHLFELAAQRITKYVEPHYISDDMLRGKDDEIYAKVIYNEKYAPLEDIGFITNDKWGFTLGYSPDAIVGEEGLIEIKSRRQKYQMETIFHRQMPDEYKIQVQTGLLVSERLWCDFISYCGGMPMIVLRVYPDLVVQKAILEAAAIFHGKLEKILSTYSQNIQDENIRIQPTERREMGDIVV